MRHNPLTAPILQILKQSAVSLSEYDLMQQLEQAGSLFSTPVEGYQLGLFKKHFMVMNALYNLQVDLAAESVYLQISALTISLQTMPATSKEKHLADLVDMKLREYYLDWNHYDATGADEVKILFAAFWQRYAAADKRAGALRLLGLPEHADWSMIRDGYRRLAQQYHPDKGGDEKRFIEVREAYEILRCCYAQS
jgi:hypothetical protein